jgi:peptidylprolyl isomerase
MIKSFLVLFFKKEQPSLLPRNPGCLPMLACASLCLAAAANDPVIAERGADQITLSQARAMIAATDPDTRHKLATDQAALQNFLRNVLLARAILAQAAAEKWDKRPDVAALLQRARDQVITQSYLAFHAAVPALYPSEAEVKSAYDQNKGRFMQPRAYHLEQIFLPTANAPAVDDGRQKLAALRAQIQHGKLVFTQAAKHGANLRYTDMGWVSEPQLTPSVKPAVAGLPEGAVSDPVCTDGGCHLLRLVATRPAGPAPLADIHDALVHALRQQRQTADENAYASGLLANQPVAINEIQLSRLSQ